MKQHLALLLVSIAAGLPSFGAPPAGYTLEWEDNFDGLTLDETKWSHRSLGPRRDGVNVVEAVTLTGEGTLKITTSKVGTEYHTGMIGTQGKFERAFGYWEARIKLQDQQGHWSAFWLQSPTVGNPIGDTQVAGTEIDVMEYHSNWGDKLQNTLHWDGYGTDHKSAAKSATIAGLKDGFHTFGVQWTPDEYVFYTDGIETWRTTTAISHRTQYAILSLEVGDWAGNIANATLPDSMEVDYVRWYEAPPAPPIEGLIDPTPAAGPGDVIDPAGGETVDQSFGTPQATLEARSDLRVLQNFSGFIASATGDNLVRFTSTTLPDIQFQFSGAFNTTSAGAVGNNTVFASSGSFHLAQRNSAAGTSTLTISFGKWDGNAFIGNRSVEATGFTLSQVYSNKSGVVTFCDSAGAAIPGATFPYSGESDTDSTGNHKDFYFGWDSTAQATDSIGSITITFTDSGAPYTSGLDDFAFTMGAPQSSSPYAIWAGSNASAEDPGEDFDNDGVPNAIEFLLGGDKDTNDLSKLPVMSASGSNMIFSFVRNRDSVDPSVAVTIEVGTDLQNWPEVFTVGGDTGSAGITVIGNSDGTDTVTLTTPKATDTKKFARLKVAITP